MDFEFIITLCKQINPGFVRKMLQYLRKAQRCVMQTSNWEKDIDQCHTVAQQSLQLADSYVSASSVAKTSEQSLQLMSSAKLMIKGVLTKNKKQHTDPITESIPSDKIRDLCSQLQEQLDSLIHNIQQLKLGLCHK